jgi:hypothetical protein
MVVNKFMCDNIMVKNKTLPLYEQNGIYNLKKRKYKNLDTLHEYNLTTQVLTKNVRCGSLWDTIKNIFKKGKNIAQKTFNYIDNSPLLNTVKDIGFDYIQQKTGINPNDYYDVAKTVVNSAPQQNAQYLTDVATKTLTDTYQKYKNKSATNSYTKPGQKGPSKRDQLKTFMKDFSNNLVNSYPDQQRIIKQNMNAFSQGIDSISAGSINLDVWKKKAPLFLLSSISQKGNGKCGNDMSEKIKEILKNRFKISDLRLPPTMKRLLTIKASGDELSTGNELSTGRLYMGHGDESNGTNSSGRLHLGNGDASKSGKKANDKYAKLLAALK